MDKTDFVTLTNNPENDGVDGYYELKCYSVSAKERYINGVHLNRFQKRYGVYPNMIDLREGIGRIDNVRFILNDGR